MILTELQGLTLSTPSQVISLMFRVKMSGRSLCFNLIITPKPLIRGVPLRARVFISDLSIIYCQPSSVKMLILTRSGDRGGPGGRGIMYAISLWLIASLRIFSGRPVLTDSACDDEASDDEMEYMILPRHILYHILKFLCMTQIFSGLLNPTRVYITFEHCLYKI